MAAQGLVAAERYGNIAPSAAHSAHMPGHIFARLGMWQADIDANLASVAASEKALEDHHASIFDQLHADDFLLYAYLQSGEDARAKDMLEHTAALLTKSEAMTQMPGMDMTDMVPYYRNKFSVFYALEMRDWKSAATLEPAPGASPIPKTLTYWARIVADGHLRRSKEAQADLAKYAEFYDQIRKGKHAYFADSTGAKVEQDEVAGWVAFAERNSEKAWSKMRAAADVQDKVGQGEVDIPAREMLADMLLELDQPKEALVEYDSALKMSPNRFNGLFNAGRAAEAAGDKGRAATYYSALLKATNDGKLSERPELAHVKTFLSATQVAAR
jgi:tetratricopeptide (TPR) repeat protein